MSENKGPFRISEKVWHQHMAGMVEIVSEPTLVGTNLTPIIGYMYRRADAERIVACLNWCEGLSTAEIHHAFTLPKPTAKELLEYMDKAMGDAAAGLAELQNYRMAINAFWPLISKLLADQMGEAPTNTVN